MKTIVLALGLAVMAAASASGKVVDRIVAQVNDDIITLSDINREMADIRRELGQRFSGEQLEEELKKAEKDVLEELIRQKLILQKARDLAYLAGEADKATVFQQKLDALLTAEAAGKKK